MDIPRYWRLRNQRYRLEGTRCKNCSERHFPPRLVCPECGSDQIRKYNFRGKGRVYSFTTVFQAPDIFDKQIPYVVALIELEEGNRIVAQLTDVAKDQIHIGMPVEMVIRRIYEDGDTGPIQYGYKFRPVFTTSYLKEFLNHTMKNEAP